MNQQILFIPVQPGTPEYSQLVEDIARAVAKVTSVPAKAGWISKEKAKQMLSNCTDKHLRSLAKRGCIIDTKAGHEYEYDEQSILDYKNKKSNR